MVFQDIIKLPCILMIKKKTTFTTPWGTFMYDKMPFGLTNVGATFQRAMDIAFVGKEISL